jgi:hypothetical protein
MSPARELAVVDIFDDGSVYALRVPGHTRSCPVMRVTHAASQRRAYRIGVIAKPRPNLLPPYRD